MATTFDEVLLDDAYSALADGGPEFSTAIIRSGAGGSVSSRAETREDYQSKYEINYGELEPSRQQILRTFAILRKGMARGFRFLAPDDHVLNIENVGWLNPATGEVVYLDETPVANTLDEFYLIKHYSDQGNNYTRRILKPSPWADVVIDWWDMSGTPALIDSATIPAGTGLIGPFEIIDDIVPFTLQIAEAPVTNFEFHFLTGKILAIDGPLEDETILRVTCEYHLPVTFTDDWQKFSVDETNISSFKVGLEELLPVELGIT